MKKAKDQDSMEEPEAKRRKGCVGVSEVFVCVHVCVWGGVQGGCTEGRV